MNERSKEPADHPSNRAGSNQITLIVPTRNEAENIPTLLNQIEAVNMEPLLDVLFVDDSTDDTPKIITELASEYSFPINLIARLPAERNGLSGAVVDGLRYAKGDWICVMDADLQHPPQTIPLLWEQAMRSGADMVVGSRRGDLFGPLGLTRSRSFTSKALTILARMVFPRTLKNVSDPLTGFFLVRRSAVDVDILQPDGFKILLEILVRCPALHVSEIQFDFASRNEGESKADFREGIRFFRHLVFLRVTVNPHLFRFIITVTSGVAANTFALWLLVTFWSLHPLTAAFSAAEIFFLWIQLGFHFWVFRDKEQANLRRGFWPSFAASQIFIFLIYLPAMWVLLAYSQANYLLINLVALVLVGFIRYGLSEQWIWTRGSMIWQHQTYYYKLHDILNIASQVQFDDLQFFESEEPLKDIDIQIRLDRQGTPSLLPGGISFDERMGRFGFGLTVLPGDFTQIIVSPLLEKSPNFLFTNVVEPVLRWNLVRKGFAFVKAASVKGDSRAILLQSDSDMGRSVFYLCRELQYAFMADDLIIINGEGVAFCYPKPVTIQQEMMMEGRGSFSFRQKAALFIRRAVYTRFSRRIGLWLSSRNIPAATLNTYLQWWVPQPKKMLDQVLDGIQYAEAAQIDQIIQVHPSENHDVNGKGNDALIERLQLSEERDSFQPHPLLAEQLRNWQGEDLLTKEWIIIEEAISHSTLRSLETNADNWWLNLKLKDRNSSSTAVKLVASDGSANPFRPSINPQRGA